MGKLITPEFIASSNPKLVSHVVEFATYHIKQNDPSHHFEHVNYTIDRSLFFSKPLDDVSDEMAYTIAANHDNGSHVSRENHHEIGAEILYNDKKLRNFFDLGQIYTMASAVAEHSVNLGRLPSTTYGKIISAADRRYDVEGIKNWLKTKLNGLNKHDFNQKFEHHWEFLLENFGPEGAALQTRYFEHPDDEPKIKELSSVMANKSGLKEYLKSCQKA